MGDSNKAVRFMVLTDNQEQTTARERGHRKWRGRESVRLVQGSFGVIRVLSLGDALY